MKKTLFVLTMICAYAGAAAAQDGGIRAITTPEGIVIERDAPVEEFTRERPRRMEIVDDEAPAAASEPAPPAAAEEEKMEFMPKNQVTVFERPMDVDTAAVKKKETKEKESEYENAFGFGARLGFGNAAVVGTGVNFKIPIGKANRIDAGVGFGLFGSGDEGYRTSHIETIGFYERRFDIDDGVLGWFVGPGVAVGWCWASKNIPELIETIPGEGGAPPTVTTRSKYRDKHDGFAVGLGGVIGLEVDLSFIDSDHSLHSLKDIMVGVDFRPMFYFPDIDNTGIDGHRYPFFTFSVGVSVRWAL